MSEEGFLQGCRKRFEFEGEIGSGENDGSIPLVDVRDLIGEVVFWVGGILKFHNKFFDGLK